MIDIHLTGTFYVLKHVGRRMVAQGSGSIIVSSTVDALIGCAASLYIAAKGGVTSLSARSRQASAATACASTRSRRASSRPSRNASGWTTRRRSDIQSLHLLPVPTPEQIAPFVVYLATDESIAVTGTVFPSTPATWHSRPRST